MVDGGPGDPAELCTSLDSVVPAVGSIVDIEITMLGQSRRYSVDRVMHTYTDGQAHTAVEAGLEGLPWEVQPTRVYVYLFPVK